MLLPPLASLRSAVPSLAGEREQWRFAKTTGVVPMLALTRLEGTRRSESAACVTDPRQLNRAWCSD